MNTQHIPLRRAAALGAAILMLTPAAQAQSGTAVEQGGLWFLADPATRTAAVTYARSGRYDQATYDIPEVITYNGADYRVTAIGEKAFQGRTTLRSVTVPDDCRHIYPNAFEGCTNFSMVNNAEAVTTIDDFAFRGCTNSLNMLGALKSLTCLGRGVFYGVSGNTLDFPPTLAYADAEFALGMSDNLQINFSGCNAPNFYTTSNGVMALPSVRTIRVPGGCADDYNQRFSMQVPMKDWRVTYSWTSEQTVTKVQIMDYVTVVTSSKFADWHSVSSDLDHSFVTLHLNQCEMGGKDILALRRACEAYSVSRCDTLLMERVQLKPDGEIYAQNPFNNNSPVQFTSKNLLPAFMFSGTRIRVLYLPEVSAAVDKLANYVFHNMPRLAEIHAPYAEEYHIPEAPAVWGCDVSKVALIVPDGTYALYENADGWQDFEHIYEESEWQRLPDLRRFDINGDGEIDVADVTALVNKILGQ